MLQSVLKMVNQDSGDGENADQKRELREEEHSTWLEMRLLSGSHFCTTAIAKLSARACKVCLHMAYRVTLGKVKQVAHQQEPVWKRFLHNYHANHHEEVPEAEPLESHDDVHAR